MFYSVVYAVRSRATQSNLRHPHAMLLSLSTYAHATRLPGLSAPSLALDVSCTATAANSCIISIQWKCHMSITRWLSVGIFSRIFTTLSLLAMWCLLLLFSSLLPFSHHGITFAHRWNPLHFMHIHIFWMHYCEHISTIRAPFECTCTVRMRHHPNPVGQVGKIIFPCKPAVFRGFHLHCLLVNGMRFSFQDFNCPTIYAAARMCVCVCMFRSAVFASRSLCHFIRNCIFPLWAIAFFWYLSAIHSLFAPPSFSL